MERYEEAIATCDKAIEFYPDPFYFYFKADKLNQLRRYEEALVAYDRAIKGDVPFAYEGKAEVLYNMERYEEAIAAYDEIISYHQDYCDPMNAYNIKGNILCKLYRYEEALVSYDNAVSVYKRYHERAYKQDYVYTTGSVNNNHTNELVALYKSRGDVLQHLGRPEEAQQSYTLADYNKLNISDLT